MSIDRLSASFRDPSGFLFTRDGVLYRQINKTYEQHYGLLKSSGLYDRLTQKGLLIPHQEVDVEPPDPATAARILQPELVRFISYPYEWSFSQLRDAAFTTLVVQRHALELGMTLKDSSAYNIQFHQGRPLLIDSLSFERYVEGEPWVAYRQFCQHFLAPLAVMAYTDIRLSQLLRVFIDGLPLDLASRLLPRKTLLRFSLLSHIHLHAAAQRRFGDTSKTSGKPGGRVSRTGLLGLLESLESSLRKLKWTPGGSEWVDYYERGHRYSDDAAKHKEQLVSEYLTQIQPSSVWDLGANTGAFSRLASDRGIPTVAFDVDPGAVERNYLTCRANDEEHLLPLVQDLTNPSPAIGWSNAERSSLGERQGADAVLALALVHHLAISNNVPFPELAQFFGGLCRWLILEFVPKSDPQAQRLLAGRPDIFTHYDSESFEKTFGEVFELRRVETVGGTERRLYLLQAR